MAKDPFLLDRGGKRIPREYLTVVQITVRMTAEDESMADRIVLSAVTVGAKIIGQLLGIAVHSQPLTKDLLQQLQQTQENST